MNVREFQISYKKQKEISKILSALSTEYLQKYQFAIQLVDHFEKDSFLIDRYTKRKLFLFIDSEKFAILDSRFQNENVLLFGIYNKI